ncbi:MAG TPA: hypothetical protein VHE35_30895, partial [Kofleriaceae bacterium]|nr:hypothetical protein [Kofleriaceae bacterium]
GADHGGDYGGGDHGGDYGAGADHGSDFGAGADHGGDFGDGHDAGAGFGDGHDAGSFDAHTGGDQPGDFHSLLDDQNGAAGDHGNVVGDASHDAIGHDANDQANDFHSMVDDHATTDAAHDANAVQDNVTHNNDGSYTVENHENYTWMGMSYDQTVRTTYDSGGNVVSTDTYRPGSVWSDHTVSDSNGTHTTYDAGGLGLAGQVTTSYDSQGRFTGVDGRGELAFGSGDYTVNAGVHGGVQVGYGDNGSLESHVNVGGDVTLTHDPSGLGVRIGGDLDGSASVHYDASGNLTSLDAHGDVSVPLSVTHDGHELAGINLLGAEVDGHYAQTDNGYQLGAGLATTGLGTRESLGGTYTVDGEHSSFNVDASLDARVTGVPGLRAGVEGGFGLSSDGHEVLGDVYAGGQVKAFGLELAGADAHAYDVPGGGSIAEGEVRYQEIPTGWIPDHLPNLPDLPMPNLSLPDSLPQFDWRPTSLPGNGNRG